MTDAPRKSPEERKRVFKLIFGSLALATVLVGLLIYLFSDALGLEAGLARMLAIGFLIIGVLDFAILRFADKIFDKTSR